MDDHGVPFELQQPALAGRRRVPTAARCRARRRGRPARGSRRARGCRGERLGEPDPFDQRGGKGRAVDRRRQTVDQPTLVERDERLVLGVGQLRPPLHRPEAEQPGRRVPGIAHCLAEAHEISGARFEGRRPTNVPSPCRR